jgi:hypothetical protein
VAGDWQLADPSEWTIEMTQVWLKNELNCTEDDRSKFLEFDGRRLIQLRSREAVASKLPSVQGILQVLIAEKVKALVDKWEKPSQNSQISQQAFALVEARDRDRAELSATLEAAAASNNQHLVLQTATGATAKPGDKYLQAHLLEYGPAQASTLGLVNFMGVDQATFFIRVSEGVDAMVREVKDRSQVEEQRADIENDRRKLENLVAEGKHALVKTKQKEIDEKTKETVELEEMLVKAERVFLYTLNEGAGSSNETFQNGWKMDCDRKTGAGLPESMFIYMTLNL